MCLYDDDNRNVQIPADYYIRYQLNVWLIIIENTSYSMATRDKKGEALKNVMYFLIIFTSDQNKISLQQLMMTEKI